MQQGSVTITPDKLSTAILLDRNKDFIIATWASRARLLFPAAEKQNTPALYNALPRMMDEVVNALSLVGFTVDGRKEVSKDHAHQRASLSGYTLKQVLLEMKVLRETIFEILEKEGGELSQRDRDIILDSLEKGIIFTGTEFVKLQMEEKNQDLYESLSTIEKLESEQRLRDLFVATLTHDLKTPLTAIKLNAKILERYNSENEKSKQILSRILSSLSRADNMIDSLLDANQMRSGKSLQFDKIEYDISKQIFLLLEEISQVHSGTKFNFNPNPEPVICRLAYDKIARAIENLLTNAIKYGDVTKPITVSAAIENSFLRISVHNFGNPIPESEQTVIFEPFFRSKTVQFGKQKGWGLGLTMVQGIIEAHGGKVELVSNANDGTTFSLVVPV